MLDVDELALLHSVEHISPSNRFAELSSADAVEQIFAPFERALLLSTERFELF